MTNENPICGIVMPISQIDGCSESHWADVLDILSEAISSAGFSANLVSNADDVGVIHKTIVQNLYENPVVVCDVSCKNSNVMFELGMRLAFDKPTIIIKDDKTPYSFDTSAIEHIEYPRDLRFGRIVEFKQKLSDKIRATYEKSRGDSQYTTFLKHFGEFKVAKLDKKEVSSQEFILEELKQIKSYMRSSRGGQTAPSLDKIEFCLGKKGRDEANAAVEYLEGKNGFSEIEIMDFGNDHFHISTRAINVPPSEMMDVEARLGRPRRSRKRSPN